MAPTTPSIASEASASQASTPTLPNRSRGLSIESSQPTYPNKKRNGPRSEIWRYFRQGNALNGEKTEDKNGNIWYYCNKCKNWSGTSTTSNAKLHLERQHPTLQLAETPRKSQAQTSQTIDTLLAKARESNPFIEISRKGLYLTREFLLEALLLYLIACNLSLSHVENPAFQALIFALNEKASLYYPRSRNTIPRLLVGMFTYYQEGLVEKLRQSQSKIHLSVDIWTSPNTRGYLAIVANWVHNWQKVTALLQLPRLLGSHTGENQAEHIFNVLSKY